MSSVQLVKRRLLAMVLMAGEVQRQVHLSVKPKAVVIQLLLLLPQRSTTITRITTRKIRTKSEKTSQMTNKKRLQSLSLQHQQVSIKLDPCKQDKEEFASLMLLNAKRAARTQPTRTA